MAVTEQHTPDEDPALLTDEEIGRLLTRAEPFLKINLFIVYTADYNISIPHINRKNHAFLILSFHFLFLLFCFLKY